MALKLIPTSKGLLGSDILKGTTEYRVSLSNDPPDQVEGNQKGLAVGVQDNTVSSQFLGPN